MRMRVIRAVLLLGLTGILTLNAMAGGGIVPNPNGPGGGSGQLQR